MLPVFLALHRGMMHPLGVIPVPEGREIETTGGSFGQHVEGGKAMLPVWDHLHCYRRENKTSRLFKPLNLGVFM